MMICAEESQKAKELCDLFWDQFIAPSIAKGPQPFRVLLQSELMYYSEKLRALNSFVQIDTLIEKDGKFFIQGKPDVYDEKYGYIISYRCLEQALDTKTVLADIWKWLALDGYFFCVAGNVRYWRVWQNWLMGKWEYKSFGILQAGIHRFFAKRDIVQCLLDAEYESICILPVKSLNMEAELPDVRVECKEELLVSFWLIQAVKYSLDEETVWLRRQYTPKVRDRLACLLRRIETGIEIEQNGHDLLVLCLENGIGQEYLRRFIRNSMVNPQAVWQRIGGE